MRGTIPTLHCDHEDGCDEWTPDFYTMTADNWRELMPAGWTYDPPFADSYCPEHAPLNGRAAP